MAFASLEVRVIAVDMLCKDGMIGKLEESLKRLEKEMVVHEEQEAA